MKKLEGKENFEGYAAVKALLDREKKDLEETKHQHSLVKIHMSQDQDRQVKEEREFNNRLRSEKEAHRHQMAKRESEIHRLERVASSQTEDLGSRLKGVEAKEIALQRKEDQLKKLGLLGRDADNIVRQKEEIIKQKADIEILGIKTADEVTRLNNSKREFDLDRANIENIRTQAEKKLEAANLKMIEADGKLTSCTQEKINIESLKHQNEAIELAIKNDKVDIEKTRTDNIIVLKNIKKIRDNLDPKLTEIAKSKEDVDANLKESKEKYTNAERLSEENKSIIAVLDERKKQQEAKERELTSRLVELKRRELLVGVK